MPDKNKKLLIIICVLIFLFCLFAPILFRSQRKIYLYAWNRNEDFKFLSDEKDRRISIVFYAGSVVIRDGGISYSRRKSHLEIPEDIYSFPVIRIDNFSSPGYMDANIREIAEFVVQQCKEASECQVDLDAKTSEYESYIKLIREIKEKLPEVRISITALASWCSSGSWLDKMPIDRAVPMLYQLGHDEAWIKKEMPGSWFLKNKICADDVALSTEEMNFSFNKYSRGKNI